MSDGTIIVKAAQLGQRVGEFALAEGATVADVRRAFSAAPGLEARIDNEKVDDCYSVEDGDIVTFVPAKSVKGGSI